jgi:hyperosmotically inducible protein
MKAQRSTALVTLLTAVAAAASMTACNRNDEDRGAAREPERSVAQAPPQQRSEDIKAEARSAAEQARQATAGAVDTMANKAKDAAITTSVNAALAKDPQLSALRIDVDTVEGRVALRGTAPDAASRDRAAELAARVDGVRSVENQLSVNPRG